jgi:hypothetical protein
VREAKMNQNELSLTARPGISLSVADFTSQPTLPDTVAAPYQTENQHGTFGGRPMRRTFIKESTMAVLRFLTSDPGGAELTQAEIASRLKLSLRTVKRAIAELKCHGLDAPKGFQGTARYDTSGIDVDKLHVAPVPQSRRVTIRNSAKSRIGPGAHPIRSIPVDNKEYLYNEYPGTVGARATATTRFVLPDQVAEGQRNDTLFRYACSLRAAPDSTVQRLSYEGSTVVLDLRSPEHIAIAVHSENLTRCQPPLPADEVAQIVINACKYKAGPKGGLIESFDEIRASKDAASGIDVAEIAHRVRELRGAA